MLTVYDKYIQNSHILKIRNGFSRRWALTHRDYNAYGVTAKNISSIPMLVDFTSIILLLPLFHKQERQGRRIIFMRKIKR